MNKTLPKGWKTVVLGDVAEEVREYEKEPVEKGIERLVGLEHIDPEDLRIHRWGLVADGTSFTKVFKKGQVLFGRRRAYQRKIAIAEFDGICSGDILVFQTKEGLIPELLPFLMQSEDFYNYALDTSAGSLSPRTKWKHLAKFEFPLPLLAKQKRIAKILWAVENSIRKAEDAVAKSIICRNIIFSDYSNKGQKVKLSTCIKERGEISLPPHQHSRYVGLEQIESGSYSVKGYLEASTVKSSCSVFHPGDLLYGKLRPYLDKAAIAEVDGVCSSEIFVILPRESIEIDYLIHIFHSRKFVQYNTHHAYGTKMPRTSIELVGNYEFYLPPIADRKQILKLVQSFLRTESIMWQHIGKAKSLKGSLMNYILSGMKGFGGDA